MIYFPTPYPDEILYSVLARYAVRNDVISRETISRELFGRNLIYSNIELPHSIGALISNLPMYSNINEELIIRKHTLFPLYTAFLSADNVNLIFDSMISNNGSQIYVKSGLVTSSIKKNSFLRFCPKCFEEDMIKYGESYWRRHHQIPGVIVCKEHECFLYDSKVGNGEDTKKVFIVPNEENCILEEDCFEKFIKDEKIKNGTKEIVIATERDILMKSLVLSKNIDFLLKERLTPQNSSFFIKKYIDVLRVRGLTNSAGFTYPDKIQNQFRNYHGEIFLKITQSLNDINDPCNWLYLFLRDNKSKKHPIRHLLFGMFLDIDLASLFSNEFVGRGRLVSKMNYEPRRKKEDVRQRYLNLMRDNPNATRSDLQVMDKGAYVWLIRYDKEWYHKVAPKKKKMIVPKDKKSWNSIDKKAILAVEEALKNIEMDTNKPVRITKAYILKLISSKVKIHNLDKLPLTKHRIELAMESLEQFRERKMKWVIKSMLSDGEDISMWKVIRRMGIGLNVSEELKKKVIHAIEKSIRVYP